MLALLYTLHPTQQVCSLRLTVCLETIKMFSQINNKKKELYARGDCKTPREKVCVLLAAIYTAHKVYIYQTSRKRRALGRRAQKFNIIELLLLSYLAFSSPRQELFLRRRNRTYIHIVINVLIFFINKLFLLNRQKTYILFAFHLYKA